MSVLRHLFLLFLSRSGVHPPLCTLFPVFFLSLIYIFFMVSFISICTPPCSSTYPPPHSPPFNFLPLFRIPPPPLPSPPMVLISLWSSPLPLSTLLSPTFPFPLISTFLVTPPSLCSHCHLPVPPSSSSTPSSSPSFMLLAARQENISVGWLLGGQGETEYRPPNQKPP